MVAAVVVAVTFQPVRRAFDRFANRVCTGARDAVRGPVRFLRAGGGTYADADVVTRMARVLGEGIGAERADVWLQVGRSCATWRSWPGGHRATRRPCPLPNGAVPPIHDMDRVCPVEAGGDLLGALAVRKPPSDPLSPADEKLVADLAPPGRPRAAQRAASRRS